MCSYIRCSFAPTPRRCFLPGIGNPCLSSPLSRQGVFSGFEGLCDTFRGMLESFLALQDLLGNVVANLRGLAVYQVLGPFCPPRKERSGPNPGLRRVEQAN